jgi:hypothetical protein
MVNEPVYNYIKGQGWVPSVYREITCRDQDGFLIRVIWREPEIGEIFFAVSHDDTSEDIVRCIARCNVSTWKKLKIKQEYYITVEIVNE